VDLVRLDSVVSDLLHPSIAPPPTFQFTSNPLQLRNQEKSNIFRSALGSESLFTTFPMRAVKREFSYSVVSFETYMLVRFASEGRFVLHNPFHRRYK